MQADQSSEPKPIRIVMAGTGTFAEPTFEKLLADGEQVVGLLTQPERQTGRKSGATRQTGRGMATIAQEANIPVIQPANVNTPDGMAELAAFQPDLLVVAAYGQILKPEVIRLPKLGAINVHASLLPKYRGASPVAHAILNGETTTGVTIIQISPGLDAGDILAQRPLPIQENETTGELEARLATLGAELCAEVVRSMKFGPVAGQSQDESLVTKAPKLTKSMGQIDWSKPAGTIARQVLAMQPWPTAYTFLHQEGKPPVRLQILQVRKLGVVDQLSMDIPVHGTAIAIDNDRLAVSTFDGSSFLEILELQPAGKKRMSAAEFLRGHPLPEGSYFGPELPQ